ncbi:MAG TPA: SAM-dependent methyltransferase [Streptosporangiaceae bacterium]|nr:SAM-dependent methyltransferase [Streptosporangiaceae bacterium]
MSVNTKPGDEDVAGDPPVPPGVDPTIPSPARLYDYYLGGTHNFPADRAAAKRIIAAMPDLPDAAWANRSFHQRAARWLAERGIRQFLDIGSGLPTAGNTHEVVRAVAADARVVYVDNDPMVALFSAGLLTDTTTAAIVTADLRDPSAVLGHPDVRALIKDGEPTALLMTAVMHFVAPASDPWGIVDQYLAALAPGSYLVLSHITADRLPPRGVEEGLDVYSRATENIYVRSRDEVGRFFEHVEMVPPHDGAPPGICYVGEWGAEAPDLADSDGSRMIYCGVGRRP